MRDRNTAKPIARLHAVMPPEKCESEMIRMVSDWIRLISERVLPCKRVKYARVVSASDCSETTATDDLIVTTASRQILLVVPRVSCTDPFTGISTSIQNLPTLKLSPKHLSMDCSLVAGSNRYSSNRLMFGVELQRFTCRRSDSQHRFLLEPSLVGADELSNGLFLIGIIGMKETENVRRLTNDFARGRSPLA